MKRLFVFADFDWLENIELVGELMMDSIRGGEAYGFKFEPSWLKKHGSVSLSDDLNNYVLCNMAILMAMSSALSSEKFSNTDNILFITIFFL